MKQLYILLYLVSWSISLSGQETFGQNNIYLELGGNGPLYSLNYERQLTKQPGFGIRVGAGFYSTDPYKVTVPVGVNYLFNLYENSVLLDIGFGVTYSKADVKLYAMVKRNDPYSYINTNYFNYIPSAGIRFHTHRNFLWRISLAPVINDYGLLPWIGVSFGKMF
jgi:hypothetical protein